MKATDSTLPAVVIGAGPSGLAVGSALKRRGIEPLILEKGDRVAPRWQSYYEGMRLMSSRGSSSLPGLRIDRGAGRWPLRHDMIRYFERFARHHRLDVEFGVGVDRVERSGAGWLVRTSAGEFQAQHVVMATGLNAEPTIPAWPGLGDFRGTFMHASEYRNATPFRDQTVLVVGLGPSGQDIALELLGADAKKVCMSVRTPPLMYPQSVLGIPMDALGQMAKRLPSVLHTIVDVNSLVLTRLTTPNLSAYGVDRPTRGLMSAVKAGRSTGSLDRGFSTAVRARQIEVLPAVEAFDGRDVVLAGGRRLTPDAVIAATGQRPRLEPLVGHLDVLNGLGFPKVHGAATVEGARGLYFVGYRLPPGQLPDLRRDSRRATRRIARDLRRRPVAGRPAGQRAASTRAARELEQQLG